VRPSNPACYECPKGKDGLHTWRRNPDGRFAMCVKCGLELNETDTAEVFEGIVLGVQSQ